MTKRFELYKAVKWEIEHFSEDCGFTLVEMWDVVNFRSGVDAGMWWRDQCLADYRARRI